MELEKELELKNNEIRIKESEITKKDNETIAKHAEFTACDGCDDYGNAWEIFSYKIIHDSEEKMLYFHNASFWIYNDPVGLKG